MKRDVQISPDNDRFSVWVDGCYKGSCATQEKAEKAARYERSKRETIEEWVVRLLTEDERIDPEGYSYLGVENTGGGCLAAAIYAEDGTYVWITDAEDFETDPSEPFYVGAYYPKGEESEWVEDFMAEANPENLVERVLAGFAAARDAR